MDDKVSFVTLMGVIGCKIWRWITSILSLTVGIFKGGEDAQLRIQYDKKAESMRACEIAGSPQASAFQGLWQHHVKSLVRPHSYRTVGRPAPSRSALSQLSENKTVAHGDIL